MVYWLKTLKQKQNKTVNVIYKFLKQRLGNAMRTNQNQKYDNTESPKSSPVIDLTTPTI